MFFHSFGKTNIVSVLDLIAMCWFLMKKGLSVNGGCRIWSLFVFWLQSSDNFPSVQLQLHLNFWIEIRIKKKLKKSRPDGRLGGNSVISLMLRMWFLVASTIFAATKEAKEPRLESPGLIVWSCKFTNCVSVTLLRYASGLETPPQNFCTVLERFFKLRLFHYQFILVFFKQVPREPFSFSTTRLF